MWSYERACQMFLPYSLLQKRLNVETNREITAFCLVGTDSFAAGEGHFASQRRRPPSVGTGVPDGPFVVSPSVGTGVLDGPLSAEIKSNK